MISAAPLPEVGTLPAPLPFEPGETVDSPLKHYRQKGTSDPVCPVGPDDGPLFARRWSDVTCNDCVAMKPKRGRKSKDDDPGPKSKPKKEQPTPESDGPDPREALVPVISLVVNETLYQNRRAPAPAAALTNFSVTVVMALDHYGLLTFTNHPLGAVVATSAVLFLALKDSPEISDQAKLDELHGRVDVQA